MNKKDAYKSLHNRLLVYKYDIAVLYIWYIYDSGQKCTCINIVCILNQASIIKKFNRLS